METHIQQRINPKPPWEQLSNKLNIDITLIGRTSKQNKETAKLDSRTLIDSYSQHVSTDASKARNGRCAAAYYVPENDTQKIIPLLNNTSIHMAELIAIKLAIESLQEFNQSGKDVIFNDALNAINSIGETRVHKHTNMIQELQQTIAMSQVN